MTALLWFALGFFSFPALVLFLFAIGPSPIR